MKVPVESRFLSPLLMGFLSTDDQQKKLALAKGVIPLPPKDKIIGQFVLAFDSDHDVSFAARKAMKEIPEVFFPLLMHDADLPPALLHNLVLLYHKNEPAIEMLLQNSSLKFRSLQKIAGQLSRAAILQALQNQKKILEFPEIVADFYKNPLLKPIDFVAILEFLQRSGVQLSIPEFTSQHNDHALQKNVSHQTQDHTETSHIDEHETTTPKEESLDTEKSDFEPYQSRAEEKKQDSSGFSEHEAHGDLAQTIQEIEKYKDENIPIELINPAEAESFTISENKEDNESNSENESLRENFRSGMNIRKRIADLTIPQKISLAMKGNKNVRDILVVDANRTVATAVLTNPGITMSEVEKAAKSKSVCREVISYICRQREWLKRYPIKLALVYNPRTPAGLTIRLLSSLNEIDLRTISKSREVPKFVADGAKKQWLKKK